MGFKCQAPNASGKTGVKVFGAAGVLILLGGLGCLALVWVWVNLFADRFAVRATADAYLHDLGSGRTESAYARTTQRFQLEQGLPQFQRIVGQSPVLRKRISWSYDRVKTAIHKEPGTVQGVVEVSLNGPDHPASLTLILVKEDGDWRIDRWYHSWE